MLRPELAPVFFYIIEKFVLWNKKAPQRVELKR